MRRILIIPVALGFVGVVACTSDSGNGDDGLAVETVSTRADAVTGGDVLIAIQPPEGEPADQATVRVDGTAAEVSLSSAGGEEATGLVEGLPEGDSTIEVSLGDETASVDVVNHPVTGPVFSGPHLPLPVCTTEANGLGPALDDDCSADAISAVRWVDGSGQWQEAADPSEIPEDALATPEGGPLVVNREIGTINRAVYWLDVPDHWNGRLVYQFGGGCGTGYTQGFRLLSDPEPDLLAAGYATATATFNTFQVLCNSVVSAETAMMVKEHFIETVGLPVVTIGQGGSGGAIQQYQIIQNYPGILDAASASVPFPDAVSIASDVLDCSLFERYFEEAGDAWDADARLAVQGHLTAGTCTFWDQTFASNVNPSAACSLALLGAAGDAVGGLPEELPSLPPEAIYDAATNPDGLRCTLQDANVNYLGADPETGFALRPWDNVGVQYGLAALNEGAVTVDQFLALNEGIGSYDIDGTLVETRAAAPEEGLEAAFATGHVIEGEGDLRRIPIITIDVFTDDSGDIHTRDRAFAVRERLRDEDGDDPPNHMIWTRPVPEGSDLVEALTGVTDVGLGVIEVLDEWATALAGTDIAGSDVADAVESLRPDAALDSCVDPDGQEHQGLDVYDQDNGCTDAFPISRSPRVVAGAPLRNDVVKCRLQTVEAAIDAGVYEIVLDDGQRERLETIFPDGVCDYSQPSVGRVPFAGTWLRYPL